MSKVKEALSRICRGVKESLPSPQQEANWCHEYQDTQKQEQRLSWASQSPLVVIARTQHPAP